MIRKCLAEYGMEYSRGPNHYRKVTVDEMALIEGAVVQLDLEDHTTNGHTETKSDN